MTATLCGSCNERARCTHKNVKTRPANIPPAKKENIRTLGTLGLRRKGLGWFHKKRFWIKKNVTQ
jgi:hypothetical protein